jgi:hypothetical protein
MIDDRLHIITRIGLHNKIINYTILYRNEIITGWRNLKNDVYYSVCET